MKKIIFSLLIIATFLASAKSRGSKTEELLGQTPKVHEPRKEKPISRIKPAKKYHNA